MHITHRGATGCLVTPLVTPPGGAGRSGPRLAPGPVRAATAPLLLLGLALAAAAGAAATARRPVDEYRLKAEFLERFTRFIEWPAGALPSDPTAPFALCVLGQDPFGGALDELARSRRIGDRPIRLSRLKSLADSAPCHLLFVAASERDHLAEITAAARQARQLTVADSEGFAAAGVIINLFVAEEKVGFEINEKAAREAGFTVSSRLLRLARRVEGQR